MGRNISGWTYATYTYKLYEKFSWELGPTFETVVYLVVLKGISKILLGIRIPC